VLYKSRFNFNELIGGRTRTRTLDPLIKSHQIALIYQAHFDISSVRLEIEPERELENVETSIWRHYYAARYSPPLSCACPDQIRAKVAELVKQENTTSRTKRWFGRFDILIKKEFLFVQLSRPEAKNMTRSPLRLVSRNAVNRTVGPKRPPSRNLRTREYLTEAEVERLMEAVKDNLLVVMKAPALSAGGP
jgi:hypothetical protein